jgi:outer membrane receptor protein involved in Fe transport
VRITNTANHQLGKFTRKCLIYHIVWLLAFIICAEGLMHGQATNGTILGTVTDSAGAVVAKANVEVLNIATGVVQSTQTTDSGDFTVPYLTPGTYKVTIQSSGFQKSVVDNVGLAVDQRARVNITLKPGTVSETVVVQANAIALDTDSAAISQLVNSEQVDQLPLNGRNFLQLLFIGAGAVETSGEQSAFRQGAGDAISINGGRPESNNYTLDGLSNTDTALNTPAIILSQDAIQEFKVLSETYSAEYGFSANQVNIVTKSGTNALHGSAFLFDRNDAFDAKGPFQQSLPPLRQNQFGFVASGPAYIPKLYDGRNKTFWLVNYEGWRIRNGIQQFLNVPSVAELNGDFSGLNLPAFDATPGSPCQDALAAGTGCMPVDPVTGNPFPGNIIPSTRFSRLAKVSLGAGLFPAPNCNGCALGNLSLNTSLPLNFNQQTYKVDQQLGRLGSVFFRWTKSNYTNQSVLNASVPFGLGIYKQDSTSWQFAHNIPIGHSMVNSFRVGHLNTTAEQGGFAAPQADVDALGLVGTFQDLPDLHRLYPGVSIQGFSGSVGSSANDSSFSDLPTFQIGDSLTINRGKHTFTTGFDYRNWTQKRNIFADFLGGFAFHHNNILQNDTGCTTVHCGTGYATADFLLGYYNDVSAFLPTPLNPDYASSANQYQYRYFAPFVQDDWKVTQRLSLNLGLRWDWRNVPTERNDKMTWFDVQNPGGGMCFAKQSLGTESIPDLGGPIAPEGNGFYRYCGRRNPADSSKTPFAPRVGFAYRLTDKTVLRGGYGIFWDSTLTREIDGSGNVYPFVVLTQGSPTSTAALPKTTDAMFPPVTLHQVSAATDGSQFVAAIISENPKNPYVQQWTVSVQRELSRNTTLEVNYIGNKGTHLLNRRNIGAPFPPSNPALCQADPTAGDCPFEKRLPFPNINAFAFLDSRWEGYSNYNAGNVKLEKHSTSMAVTAVYTWAKSLDDKSSPAGTGATYSFAGHLDDRNPRLDYAPSDFNVDHRFAVSYVYQFPIGRGKKFLGNVNKAVDLALGGWALTGITTFQKGFPFSVFANDTFGLLDAFTQRADLTAGCDPYSGGKRLDHWFNTSCFTQPLAGAFGTSGRNILRQPGINNWDMGVGKTFAFTERVGLQLRLETFNTFNHPNYTVPTGNGQIGVSAVDPYVNNQFPSPAQTFGKVILAKPGRIVQLGGKLTF